MNRMTLLTAAGILSAALACSGCEQEKKSTLTTAHGPNVGSAEGETMQATGSASGGAKHGTGTTSSGVTTGNATTGGASASATGTSGGVDASASASGTSSSSSSASSSAGGNTSAAATGEPAPSAAGTGQGPAEIDQAKTTDAAAAGGISSSGATPSDAKPADEPKAAETAVGVGPSGVDQSPAQAPAATDAKPTEPATGTETAVGPSGVDQRPSDAAPSGTAAAAAPAAADKDEKHEHAEHAEHADATADVKPAKAAPKELQVTGTVKFAKAEHGVKVMYDLKGLTPNAKHGFHIHEKGDLSDPKLQSVGSHFNPGGKKHGGAEGEERHGGDLGNITADEKGHAKGEVMAHGITIDGEKDGILNRSVIVHAKPDDEKSDPSGNSGDRIAGGKIEKAGEHKAAQTGTGDTAQPTAPAETTTSTPAQPAKPAPSDEDLNK